MSMVHSIKVYADRRALWLLWLGFCAGMPILLIFSTLSLWLSEAGVELSKITMFSWAALGYSFKFMWSPLIDSLRLPILTQKWGKRRAWLLLAQVLIVAAIGIMGSINPQNAGSLYLMALGAVLLGFASATQDVVIDAYRIEMAPDDAAMQTVLSSTYTAGYRLGMIVAGAGSLFLAEYWGSTPIHYVYDAWRNTYWLMAVVMTAGVLMTLTVLPEPRAHQNRAQTSARDNLRLLVVFIVAVLAFIATFRALGDVLPIIKNAPLLAFAKESAHLLLSLAVAVGAGSLLVWWRVAPRELVQQTWVAPIADFFHRYGKRAVLLLALIGLYRISDIVAGAISNVFYANMGFDKEQIAWAVKTFGVTMSIAGGFMGGVLAQKIRIMRMMMLGAIATAATNLLFMWLAMRGKDVLLMYFAVGVDNFAGGLAATVFVVFLSSLTNIRFTAVQYALLSSLMTLSPKILGGYSGAIVKEIGYEQFFLLTALLGVPIVLLVWLADKYLFNNEK